MFAIIKTGGKQIKVQKDDEIFIELLNEDENTKVTFNEVLMIDDKIGAPFIKGATVTGTIIKNGKDKKIRVIRYHSKKNIRKVYGHRQPYTKIKIDAISTGASATKKVTTQVPEASE
ncbi:50S ribosomal protein L21 [Spiroplasma endosymbiont of Labia minor]|uniref:50S ribosomal protein L21 n=1 Tax=Spiroplasma endosymbiont of Labia minor TaxID=3066305 RepID=UPI0030CB9100